MTIFQNLRTEPPFRANLIFGYTQSGPERTSFSGPTVGLYLHLKRHSKTSRHQIKNKPTQIDNPNKHEHHQQLHRLWARGKATCQTRCHMIDIFRPPKICTANNFNCSWNKDHWIVKIQIVKFVSRRFSCEYTCNHPRPRSARRAIHVSIRASPPFLSIGRACAPGSSPRQGAIVSQR